jgi:putative transposase
MDGKGAWRDNHAPRASLRDVIERLWRTVKYEEVYLRACANVSQARASIGRSLGFCNGTRPHSSPGGRTPDQTYLNQLTPIPAAARPRRKSTWRSSGSCSHEASHLFLLENGLRTRIAQ